MFVEHRVNVVFAGHEHFYERVKPQKGIQYFVAGASAKLRRGDIDPSAFTAFGYDQGYTFMLVEIDGDQMHFQTITDQGQTVDSGVVFKGADDQVVGTAGRRDPKPAAAPKPAQGAPAARPKP
jgi:hypothetical protein